MKERYLYTDNKCNKWYEYRGHTYCVTPLPITTEKEQHYIEQGFIDGEILVQQYNDSKKVGDTLNK